MRPRLLFNASFGDLMRFTGELLGDIERCLCGEFRGEFLRGEILGDLAAGLRRTGDNLGDLERSLRGESLGDLIRGEALRGDILGDNLRGGVNRLGGAYFGDLERERAALLGESLDLAGDKRGGQRPLGDLDLDLRSSRGDLDLKKSEIVGVM